MSAECLHRGLSHGNRAFAKLALAKLRIYQNRRAVSGQTARFLQDRAEIVPEPGIGVRLLLGLLFQFAQHALGQVDISP